MAKSSEPTSLQWIAAKLKRLRLERGLRLQDIADRMGTAHSRVSDAESAKYDIKLATLMRHVDALGTTLNDFFQDMPRLDPGEGTREKTRTRTKESLESLKSKARERNAKAATKNK